jgi:hypothetical protein
MTTMPTSTPPAGPRPPGRPNRTALVIAVGAVVAALSLASAGMAQADSSTYLQRLQEQIPYVYNEYGSQTLLHEGNAVCGYAAQGMDTFDATHRVVADLPMSISAASWVVLIAQDELGC